MNKEVNAYRASPPEQAGKLPWYPILPTKIILQDAQKTSTDDWPFLFLQGPFVPLQPTAAGMLVMGLISMGLLYFFRNSSPASWNWQMFFLGAGFMLLETKGVVHMALLFGSTWRINSIVFASILAMSLVANFYVAKTRPKSLRVYYFLLTASLTLNIVLPLNYFLSLPELIRPIVSCAVVFVPIFFSGVIFAASFKESRDPHSDMGSNIAGAILGGLSENFSLMLGFSRLLVVAAAFYLLSLVLRPRKIL